MANQSFRGAVATQYYRWGYTCEFCKGEVEKRSGFSTRNGSMHKSTSWTYTTAAGAEAMKEQARQQLNVAVAQMQAKIDAGQFAPPEKEDGRCPHCKKLQHWSPALREYAASQYWSEEKRKKENRGVGCGLAFIFFWVGVILSIVVGVTGIVKTPGKGTLADYAVPIGCVILCEVLGLTIGKRLIKKDASAKAAALRELEGLEKQQPRFIAWEEQTADTIGLSIR